MPQDEEIDIEEVFFILYKVCVENFNMSLFEVDNTNFETLIEYIFHEKKNKNVKIINGKMYVRAEKGKVPSWL